jgi:formate dehydrogenase maturation protein FdhE
MSFLATGKVNHRARIERAELLAQRYSFAGQILGFYGHIARFQKEFYERLPKLWGKRTVTPADGNPRSELNLAILLAAFGKFLSLIESQSPGPLSAHSRQLRMRGETEWANVLTEFWKVGLLESGSAGPLTEFSSRAFLQPYAEFLVGALLPPALPMTVCRCPRCNSLPLLGVLRPEGDGGKRFLQCSFCSQEWEFRRILCAHCGEEQEQKLPVYVAEQFPHVRVECCETCKHFLRTIDLTKDGKAVPIVDDLAAIPLSLWAEENGYKRIQGNLLGT